MKVAKESVGSLGVDLLYGLLAFALTFAVLEFVR